MIKISFIKNEKAIYVFATMICIILIAVSFLMNPILQTKATGNVIAGNQSALPIFNRMQANDEALVRQIVLADTEIQSLIEDKEYSFNVSGHQISGKDWDLAVGVILKEGANMREWLKQGKTDKSVIEKVVGVLNIGHNDSYLMSIDIENERVNELSYFSRKAMPIKELTVDEKEAAVRITLNDSRVKELLRNKQFKVAPEGVGIWVGEGQKIIGASLEIWLDQSYEIEYDWPYPEFDKEKYPVFPHYIEQSQRKTQEVKALSILVDLNKQKVVAIISRPVTARTEDLYK